MSISWDGKKNHCENTCDFAGRVFTGVRGGVGTIVGDVNPFANRATGADRNVF